MSALCYTPTPNRRTPLMEAFGMLDFVDEKELVSPLWWEAQVKIYNYHMGLCENGSTEWIKYWLLWCEATGEANRLGSLDRELYAEFTADRADCLAATH